MPLRPVFPTCESALAWKAGQGDGSVSGVPASAGLERRRQFGDDEGQQS